MVDTCLIYALLDPETEEVRYIGKTIDIKSRIREHRFSSHNPNSPAYNTRKARWWRSLGDQEPNVEIVETVPLSQSDDVERSWIRTLRDFGFRLTNLTDGGEGWPVGVGHSEESKAKMRERALANGAKPPSQAGAVPWNKGMNVGKASSTSFAPGRTPWNKGQRKQECVHGHLLTDENRYITPAGRYAGCKSCIRANYVQAQMRLTLNKEN